LSPTTNFLLLSGISRVARYLERRGLQDGNSDLDVAFDVEKVKEILTLEDGETDFCDADKGEISAALYIHGYT
jgi:hypothetical protein